MNDMRARLEREQYQVDSHAVAGALIERLMAGRLVLPPRPAR